ncbi:hypothetical protein GCM10023210_17950 [Chryseobacterium ginsengisoli]|uniref:TonB-dependent receptor n=1 Tax=Chryseobacterium ginsengisoli TaxID=363853 RepID=A0ABP9M5K6_9FLAO
MKSLYIIAFLALSLNIYAQENKKVSETQTQEAASYKESKEFEAKMMKQAQERAAQKPPTTIVLASDQGLEVKKQAPKQESSSNNSGKLLANTASMDEVLASVPGRKSQKSAAVSNGRSNTQGLLPSSNLTIQDIKKTIPKN